MIINEECYKDVKKTLDDLKAKCAGAPVISGGAQHEIEVRERDLELYDAVSTGRYPLPDLQFFKEFARQLVCLRVNKNITLKALVERLAPNPNADRLSEEELIAYEVLDYLPAKFEVVQSVAIAISEISAHSSSSLAQDAHPAFAISDYTDIDERILNQFRNFEKAVDKQTPLCDNWFGELSAPLMTKPSVSWTQKVKEIARSQQPVRQLDYQAFLNFGEVLNMWRVGKKWSYRQLAEAAGLEWFQLWHLERNSYFGALLGTMYRIADIVQLDHAPSSSSFDPEPADAN